MGKAMRAARRNGTRVAFSLSDKFCVDRFRAEFHRLIDDHIDILFANEAEIAALAETDDFDAAMRSVAGRVEIAALTRSEHGSVIEKKYNKGHKPQSLNNRKTKKSENKKKDLKKPHTPK